MPTDLPNQMMEDSQEPLYSIWAIVLATVLGSPVAGGVLSVINCKRLLRPEIMQTVFLLHLALTVGFVLLGEIVPDGQQLLEAVLVGLQVFVVYFFAVRLHGRAIAVHVQNGGQIASYWSAAAIGIGCGLALLWILVGLGLMSPPQPGLEDTGLAGIV